MPIPKIIHYVWLGRGRVPLPKEDQEYIEGWQKLNPDFKIKHWDERNVDYSKYPLVEKALKEKRWALASDIIRMIVMYEYGGIYLDTDIELLKPLDGFTKYKGFACWEAKYWFTTAAFGAEKHSPWIAKILKRYELANKNQKISTETFLKTVHSPSVYAEDIYHIELDGKTKIYGNNEFATFASDYFCPKHYMTGDINVTKNTVAIHHYASTWHTRSEKIKNDIARTCYKIAGAKGYERLEKRYHARLEKKIRKELP